LRQWISLTLGKSKWDELIRMEADIRKQRQETLYRQRERRQKFMEITVLVVAMVLGVGFLGVVVYFGMKNRGMI
jgi:hypothetical protein